MKSSYRPNKNWIYALLITFILQIHSFSYAQTAIINNTHVESKDKDFISRQHTWEIGPEISFIEYQEPGVMKEEGSMLGVGAAYTFHDGVMFNVSGKISYGQMDYKNSGTVNNIDNNMFEIRAVGGYDFIISNSFMITPFIGFGYRFLEDDGAGKISSTGHVGYLRESNYFYSPIGIRTISVLDNGWLFGAVLEYDYLWKGRQESYLSDINMGYNDIENSQDGGYGLRGSITLKKQTDLMFFALEPFIRYWNIDKSDIEYQTYYGRVTGIVWEPKNKSTEIGIKFAIGF